MLQLAFAGSKIDDVSSFNNDKFNYFEPGFNIFTPLEFSMSKSDEIYFSLRKRNDIEGTSFDNINLNNCTIVAKDITTGRIVTVDLNDYVYANELNEDWFELFTAKNVFITMQTKDTVTNKYVRIVECTIIDNSTKDHIIFRIIMDISDDKMYFLIIDNTKVENRRTFSFLGSEGLLKVSEKLTQITQAISLSKKGDSYVLLSPFISFNEVKINEFYDFSYPLDTFYYQRRFLNNNEDYVFDIVGNSHDFILDNADIFPVPGYSKVGVLTIDQKMASDLSLKTITGDFVSAFIDVRARGVISNSYVLFRLYFVR